MLQKHESNEYGHEQLVVAPAEAARPRAAAAAGGWAIEILPYLEEVALWQQLKDGPRTASAAEFAQYRPKIMTCPDAWDGSSSISSIPTSHYTMRVIVSRKARDYAGFSDVALSTRIPWIQSPENLSTPSGGGPHERGYFDSSGHFFGD